MDPATTTALIEESAKRSGLIWVKAQGSDDPARPLWHVWADGVAYVLTGGIEQPAPVGLDQPGTRADVTIRSKDAGSRLVTFPAAVERVMPDSDTWRAVVPTLQSKRLNTADGEAAPGRWARDCVLYALRPDGSASETPDSPSTSSHARRPPATNATTPVPRPWHLFGRSARARKRHQA